MASPETVTLSPELARHDSDEFRRRLVYGLGENSTFGIPLWNATAKAGVASYAEIHVTPNSWVSRSNSGTGKIFVGTQPMPQATRDKLIFDDKNHSYTDEVTHRFLHEVAHGFVFANKERQGVGTLLEVARKVRSESENLGLTAIGSLAFYNSDARPGEDAAELIAMYTFNPDRFQSYVHFLGSSTGRAERARVGIAEVASADSLVGIVENALVDGLR